MQAEEHVEGCLFFLHLHISFVLTFFSRFLQMRLEVALCADSPYIARREKSFWKYSTAQHSLPIFPVLGYRYTSSRIFPGSPIITEIERQEVCYLLH